MTGSWARVAIRFAATVTASLLAVAVSGTAGAAANPSQGGGVTCQYIVLASWSGGFTADLRIVNNGPPINGWTARWSTPVPTSNVVGWSAWMTQRGSEITAVNMSWNATIPTNGALVFGWSAAAPSTDVPTDISVNGSPC
jgi:cellulase/cellobiase CelA1